MMTATREIARSAPDVFAFLADAANNPKWQNGMKTCEWITPAPVAVGSRYDREASFLGRPVLSTFEVLEFDPGHRILIESTKSTFPIRVERRVDSLTASTCRVKAEIEGGPSVPGSVQRLVGWLAQRAVDRDYNRLVTLLED
ncbi:MAG: SRPBCC family protein [Actinomycetota bacterium]|nr:SRPBCC family protein [Actinomycetota bacterium]